MLALSGVLVWIKETFVIFHFEMRELDPHSGRIESVDVRGEAAIGLVEIRANLLGVGDRAIGIMRGLLEISLAVCRIAIGAREHRGVAVCASRAVLGLDYPVDGLVHRCD